MSFPTSGSPAAQQHFLRGVAILHSFGWKQAIAEFKLAQQAQPDFAMAYWGETLCYNHPLHAEQDAKNPRAVLARLGPTRDGAPGEGAHAREKGFLGAVEALWGEGDWRAAPRRLHERDGAPPQAVPDDDEVKTFYALSLLSGARALDDNTFRYEMKAGALALDVVQAQSEASGRAALHHPRVRRSDSCAAGARGRERLREHRRRRSRTPSTCRRTSSSSTGCGTRWRNQNVRAFQIAKDLWEPGDVPGDMAHSGDWGQYGFLQLGDYAGARDAHRVFEEMAETTKHPRAVGALALHQGALHHRDRRVEGAAGGRQRVERDGASPMA